MNPQKTAYDSVLLSKRKNPETDMRALEELLEKQYLARNRPTEFKTKTSFAPSSIGFGNGNCPRRWVISFRGADMASTADALGIARMANGTSAHERIESLFEEAGILVSKEVEINMKNPPIRGFIDVMIRWGDETVIGEIKTTSDEAFAHRKAYNKPAPYHLLQLLIYLRATKKERGFLLYENTNNNKFLIIEVTMDPQNEEVLDYALDWMREVFKAHTEGQMPKPVYQQRNKFCQECPVYETCWSDTSWDVKIPKLEVKEKIENVRESAVPQGV